MSYFSRLLLFRTDGRVAFFDYFRLCEDQVFVLSNVAKTSPERIAMTIE
jgi:hypothetical protein